ncbi:MAG: glucosidase [Planctomycetes bacterium RBG_16_55_9]|nr:MAG: glucosidase [Planctomycetes bacterium RBG_16_55_9]
MKAGSVNAERNRLSEDARRIRNWKRWGPYLSERQWGTVREDYSPDGACWEYFPHDHARSRAYRWGEDGLLGITDRECRLCFALTMWNGRDPILKERLFGLTNRQGNHGEDVKEVYYYLDATPTSSYLRGLYRYPQRAFPYEQLVSENRRRTRDEPEFELTDTNVFDDGRFFDVYAEYAKASDNDILIRITVCNRGGDEATLHLLPTLWFRNTWIWDCRHEGCTPKPNIVQAAEAMLVTEHETLGRFSLSIGPDPTGRQPPILFTENETNTQRLHGAPAYTHHTKDAFHDYLVGGCKDAVSTQGRGTKAAAHYLLTLAPGEQVAIKLRLREGTENGPEYLGREFDRVFALRMAEADDFYDGIIPARVPPESRAICRQAYAGLLWSKQFYHYVVEDWLNGDPAMPAPPPERVEGRNADWLHLFNRDVVSVPDKWEYPWYASWDTAFHAIGLARIDPDFAKRQLILPLREWYMHPNGQIPAYEFAFSDANPPVHAWACWRLYKMTGPRGKRDRNFLQSVFQKLLLNFTWWVNRKDPTGKNVFSGGFLGLDNIGLFDRSRPLPGGGHLNQADGTAWMAFYCGTMLSIALELAVQDEIYEDMASKFFEHFVHISSAMNTLGGTGLWDEEDGFYYDQIQCDGQIVPLKIRSVVGLLPIIAVEIIEQSTIDRLSGFKKRMKWFLENRRDLARFISYMSCNSPNREDALYLLAIPSAERLQRALRYLLDENEFLSPFGIRSMSKVHAERPISFRIDGQQFSAEYCPGESRTELFGGNSNWRGPIWFPVNYLLIDALQRYHYYYGDALQAEFPTGSGQMRSLAQIASELSKRLVRLFLTDETGHRPGGGTNPKFALNPLWKDLVCFHEYFHAETGQGLGASHQTGWTSLVTRCLEDTV